MALEEEGEVQNAPFCMLFCEEERSHELEGDESVVKFPFFHLGFLDHDMLWDDDELSSLISKENELRPCLSDTVLDEFLVLCREKALDWIFRVKTYYGFNALTALLAVNYFDRFLTSRKFQTDKPWMSQLTAVACLSLAAKVEEIRVPLLLDLQVSFTPFSDSVYVMSRDCSLKCLSFCVCLVRWEMRDMSLRLRLYREWSF